MTRHASRFQRWIPALHWSFWVLIASTIVILVGTLLPFKFSIADWSLKAAIDEFFFSTTTWEDRYNNILLFMPYGFAGMAWLQRGRQQGPFAATDFLQRLSPWLVTVLASTGLSCLVELLQTFLPSRSTSINDVVTNTLGGFLGAGLWWLAKQWLRSDARWWQWVKRSWRNPRVVALLLITWAGMMIILPIGLQKSAQIQGWDSHYPLVIGNEVTGDRPWDGEVKAFMMADRALSEDEIAKLLQMPSPALPSPIADYRFEGSGPYGDRSGHGPTLTWQGKTPEAVAETQGAVTHPEQWLLSNQPATHLSTAIERSQELTAVVVAKTHTLDQTGPARIISLSQDTTHRNFTLGQGGDNITVRLRTPMAGNNGDLISLTVPNALTPHQVHRLVVTYRQGILSLYIDRPEQRHVLQLTPEISLVRFLFPSNGRSLRLTPKAMVAYQSFYYLFFCAPLGILLGQSLSITRMNPVVRSLVLTIGLALPTLGLTLLMSQTQGFGWPLWGLCLGLASLALGSFLWIQNRLIKRKVRS
ncbi:MAG: hypothetical protein B0A82_10845 [Alkalinema sp. CACIAM 70d]|nr:MAG: hypothetical protein B0A82_10845 [Alkalinema sp. CACIAM 70d]